MVHIDTELKRWTVIDKFTNKLHDITDKDFNDGLVNGFIKLRGQFIQVENRHKIWIDGILVK